MLVFLNIGPCEQAFFVNRMYNSSFYTGCLLDDELRSGPSYI